MAFLDGTVVNVALPVMQSQLGASVEAMQWVVESYALLLASLVLVGGALGDRYGRRRVFTIGVVIFSGASVACGIAPDPTYLIVARAVQGAGAALLVPGSLALITAAYAEEGRGRAIGTWSSASAVTASIGPVVGGWVVEHASWRWLFFFNLVLGIGTVALALRHVGETRDDTASGKLDWLGALLAIAGLGAIVYGLLDPNAATAAGAGRALLFGGAGVVLLVAFAVAESRQRSPMMPLSLFRSRSFSGANLLTLFLYAALGGALFFVPFNLIQVQGAAPSAAGAMLLPLVILISALSPWTGGLVRRLGARPFLLVGPVVVGLGFGLLAVPGASGSYWVAFLPGVTVLGLGMGLTVAPLTTTVMQSADRHHAGVASGINNAVARAAGLLAVAAFGVLLRARFNATLDAKLATVGLDAVSAVVVDTERVKLAGADLSRIGDAILRRDVHAAFVDAYVAGFRVLMIASAALGVLSAAAAFLWIGKEPPEPSREADRPPTRG